MFMHSAPAEDSTDYSSSITPRNILNRTFGIAHFYNWVVGEKKSKNEKKQAKKKRAKRSKEKKGKGREKKKLRKV
ncbi:hypothetical protein POVWA2_044440 [Plasmodium ovale wallikeri]|uniref:Uncharacterized protein n=1 Tax=Plasmodium ovale wallikeri TaxID=864142 RepID=A0A1A8ZFS1_PLAOA|nr:hypothetical protein POVWA2_044440 [Plasmodium ovale wallikeri]